MKLQSLPRILRTVVHIRPRQLVAQVAYAMRGAPSPARLGSPPALALACARDVSLGAPEHARWTGGARISLVGREMDFGEAVDWDFLGEGPLWSYHLHQFDYARQPSLAAADRTRLLLDWVERHPSGTGWNPHPISLRILSWGKLLLTEGALDGNAGVRERIAHSLSDQVETLARNLEVRLQANHLLSNLIGVVYGGLLFEGPRADAWLALEGRLRAELARQVHADGGHEERSPMYHALLLENVLDLLALARASSGRAPAALVACLEDCGARMLGALGLLTHPDGDIALFSDSALGIAHRPAALEAYGRALGVHPRGGDAGWLAQSGFARLEVGPWTLIASVGGPAPAHQPGHAHCDALSFELSLGDRRIVTDTGVTEYIPGPLRDHCRQTSAHATLEVAGVEQAEIWAAHRVGGRPSVTVEGVDAGRWIEASCASWSSRATRHRRRFEAAGESLRIHDTLEGPSRPIRLFLPLAPGLRPELAASGSGEGTVEARIAQGDGRTITIGLPAGVDWRVERTAYFPRFGSRLDRACLVGTADRFEGGDWHFAATVA